MRGSSPLARGLLGTARTCSRAAGIIPARAGFTRGLTPLCRCQRDHPRSRGVYGDTVAHGDDLAGSSPLARGLPICLVHRAPTGRIIPARAGFTPKCCRRPRTWRDHPRSRGVYAASRGCPGKTCGSSPLARGLPSPSERNPKNERIIPARAGFTSAPCAGRAGPADHPRSRGVYVREHGVKTAAGGSSPLARGLHPFHTPTRGLLRIIPARAGFTRDPARDAVAPRDHPRSRGVYPPCIPRTAGAEGSSPLARGLPPGHPVHPHAVRIIPARAGFTVSHTGGLSHGGDHPRSRGVYGRSAFVMYAVHGSSPLARGLLKSFRLVPADGRIIPARAGFTLADRWYPNEPVVYQTPAAFTADPGPAPPGRRSVAVVRGGASPLPDVLDATRPPRVFPAPVREPLRHAQTSGSVIRLEADRVDRADPHRHERGDDPRQGSDPGCRHQSDERGGHGEGRVVRHRDI